MTARVAESFQPARPLVLARLVRSAEPAPSEPEPEEGPPELAATYACFSDAEDAPFPMGDAWSADTDGRLNRWSRLVLCGLRWRHA